MILAADIGNSSITLGALSESGDIALRTKLSTDTRRSADEYAVMVKGVLDMNGQGDTRWDGIIVSSVVPQLTVQFCAALERVCGRKSITVGPGIKTGLNIKVDIHTQLGADIVANFVAAISMYGAPVIIADLGTASTLTVINAKSELCGVIIYPGARLSLDALAKGAAELPYISLDAPKGLIGRNTVDSMSSGIIYGSACMLDGLVGRVCEQLELSNVRVIATGGLAERIIPYCRTVTQHCPDLVLRGLYDIYKMNERNQKAK
ncbi:MAG: type III pantothenate kinase [Eubacteriales bacterium]